MNLTGLLLFAAGLGAIIYIFNSLIAQEFKKIDLRQAVLYFTTVALIGVFGEIFLDSFYNLFVGRPLWYYNILPIQHGYTSSFAIITWGLYGFHLYLLHGSLAAKWSINKTKHLSLIFSFEALVLEALLTLSTRVVFGKFLYYYLPGDLWHVSSFQNIPFYFICSLVILKTLRRFKADPVFFSAMCLFLTFVLVFLAK